MAFAVEVLAQSPQFSVAGTVVNSETGEPLKYALVQLTHFPSPGKAADDSKPFKPITKSAITDIAGAFRFDGLEPGAYNLNAQKPEFTLPPRDNNGASPLSFQLTASREDLSIPLSPLGVITGKVVDQDGQPIAHVSILAISTLIRNGRLQIMTDRTVSSDDRGIYRMWNLSPRAYYLKAAGRSGGTATYLGDVPPWYTSDEAFAPEYYGGATALDGATPVPLAVGGEAHADFTLRLRPAYKIRGTLSNAVGTPPPQFELRTGDEASAMSRVSFNANSGRFEIQDVVEGSYTIRVTQGSTVGEAPVNVAGADVNGAHIALTAPVDIRVTSKFVGTPPKTDPSDDFIDARGLESSCFASLIPTNRHATQIYAASPTPRDSPATAPDHEPDASDSVISGVPPGSYRISLNCGPGYPTSVLFGSQDVLANPILSVQPGIQPPSIDVVAKFGGGVVSGKWLAPVQSSGQQFVGVLLMPQSSQSQGPLLAFVRPGENGERAFEFSALAPGMYMAYGFSNVNAEEYRNPEFFRNLSGGVAVQVTDGAETTVTIKEVVR